MSLAESAEKAARSGMKSSQRSTTTGGMRLLARGRPVKTSEKWRAENESEHEPIVGAARLDAPFPRFAEQCQARALLLGVLLAYLFLLFS
jgi:hypothetical protein